MSTCQSWNSRLTLGLCSRKIALGPLLDLWVAEVATSYTPLNERFGSFPDGSGFSGRGFNDGCGSAQQRSEDGN